MRPKKAEEPFPGSIYNNQPCQAQPNYHFTYNGTENIPIPATIYAKMKWDYKGRTVKKRNVPKPSNSLASFIFFGGGLDLRHLPKINAMERI